jgi:hypothetical protein
MEAGRTAEQPAFRTGRVVDRKGDPVPEALVSIVESTVPMPEIALQSDHGGHFALRLPPGRFKLRAHGGGATGETEVEGEPADDEIVIVVVDS